MLPETHGEAGSQQKGARAFSQRAIETLSDSILLGGVADRELMDNAKPLEPSTEFPVKELTTPI
jgi:hypothetical protein